MCVCRQAPHRRLSNSVVEQKEDIRVSYSPISHISHPSTMHTDGHDPQHIPTEKKMDDGWDVVPGPVPAPVPITIGGHHQVLKENIQVVPGPVPAPVPITIGGHHQVLRENIQDAILLWLLSVAKLVLKILTSPM
jgi:hypothetical protein